MAVNRLIVRVDGTITEEINFQSIVSGLTEGDHTVTVEAYDGNTLVNSQSKNFSVGTTATDLQAYIQRVKADYGIIEDSATLANEVTQDDLNTAIAIYNPNGGYRTGKIYDVSPNNHDLTVTGGGGTRINKEGKVEKVVYNEFTNSLNIPLNGGGFSTTSSTEPAPDGSNTADLIQVDSNTNYFIYRNLAGNQMYASNLSIYAKHVAGSHNILTLEYNDSVDFNIETGTITTSNPSYNPTIEDVGNGWYRCAISVEENSGVDAIRLEYNSPTIGDQILLWGIQWSHGSSELRPFQRNTGTAAFPKIDYSTGKPAFLIEPARTNLNTYSYNLTDASYGTSGIGSRTLSEIGITGEPNTATILTDNDTSASYSVERSTLIATSGNSKLSASVWIKKDTNQSRFPEFWFAGRRTSSATLEQRLIHLNTATGEIVYRAGDTYNGSEAITVDRGDWWELIWTSNSPCDRFQTMAIRPSFTDVIGQSSGGAATGSIIIGYFGIFDSPTPTTPIITNGAVVTRTVKSMIATLDIPATQGLTFYCKMRPTLTNASSLISLIHGSSNEATFSIGLNGSGHLIVSTTGGNVVISTTPDLTIPHAIVVTKDPSNNYLYKVFHNGSLVGSFNFVFVNFGYNTLSTAGRKVGGGLGTPSFTGELYAAEILPLVTDQEAINLTTI